MKTFLVLAVLSIAVGAATPAVQWAPKSDRGFDLAMEQRKYVVELFVKSKCADCVLLEKKAFRDPDVLELLAERFIAIRSDASKPDSRTDAENYGIESFPTMLFFDSKGAVLEGATLEGPVDGPELFQHLLNITKGKFEQSAPVQTQISTTGQAVQGAQPSNTGWSRPDTSSTIAPPPLPDTTQPATP